MIDHLLAFASEADAQSDPVVGPYWIPNPQGGGAWRGDVGIPGVFVWSPANDTTSTQTINGEQVTVTTHAPYDGLWRIVIALPAQDAGLSASAACELVADRDAANAGQPFVRQSSLPLAALATLMLQPVFAGANYPFGAPN